MVDLMNLLSDVLIGSFQMLMLNDLGKNMFPYRIKTCWTRILIYGVTALVILGVNHIESTFINIMMVPVSYTIASIVIFQGSVWKKIILACCYYMLAIVPEFLFAVITGAYGVTGTENNFHSELEKLLSLLLMSQLGIVISKAPKNEAAKTMKTRKKMILGSQWVASQLKISAVTASPPMIWVIRIMTAIGTVYSRMMQSPYNAAMVRPRVLFSLPLRKNETVMGTIGKTQGVSSAANPHKMASIIALQSEPPRLDEVDPSVLSVEVNSVAAEEIVSDMEFSVVEEFPLSVEIAAFWVSVPAPSVVEVLGSASGSVACPVVELVLPEVDLPVFVGVATPCWAFEFSTRMINS